MLMGFVLVFDGGKINKQSKYYVCMACYNIKKEDLDFSVFDLQVCLEYVWDNGLFFLQGIVFYGVVNWISFYNGDYE